MKLVAFLCVLIVAAAWGFPQGIDIGRLIQNDSFVTPYIQCLLDRGPCNNLGQNIKRNIPSAIRSRCNTCPEDIKPIIAQAIISVMNRRPQDWQALRRKYDPRNRYGASLRAFLRNYGR